MVSQKTQDEDVKKKTAKVSAKKDLRAKRQDNASEADKAAKKNVSSSKRTAARGKTKAAGMKEESVKSHVSPIDEVLTIKAHNEEKKLLKNGKKTAVNDIEQAELEKGNKALPASEKHAAVKEKALKAETKKFISHKEEAEEEFDCCLCCAGSFSAWARAYKGIFDFKGRASRYEFWAFMLINFVFMTVVLWSAGIGIWHSFYQTGALNWWLLGITALVLLAEFFVYLALIVRRLHDSGKTAWKKNFRPLVYSGILTMALSYGGEYVMPYADKLVYEGSTAAAVWGILYGLILLALMLCYLYYAIKVFFVAGFYEEEADSNAYGQMRFVEDCFKEKSFKYAALYGVLFILNYAIIKAFSVYFLLGGLGYYGSNGSF